MFFPRLTIALQKAIFVTYPSQKTMNVSERIKAIRKTKGLSQQEVAEKIGIDRAQYSRVETGKSEPTITSLTKIAQALEVSVIDFFSDAGRLSRATGKR